MPLPTRWVVVSSPHGDQDEAGGQQLGVGEPVVLRLGGDQGADEVVAGVGPAAADEPGEVLLVLLDRRLGLVDVLAQLGRSGGTRS